MNTEADRSSAIVETALADLRRDGYSVLRGAVPSDWCDDAIAAFRAWLERNPEAEKHRSPEGRLPRLTNLHLEDERLARLFEIPDVLAVQDRALGGETILYTSLYYQHGSSQPYHRDAPYFATLPVPNKFLGVWFAFEPTNERNGALGVLSGGHKVGEVDPYALARKHFSSLADVPPIHNELWNDYQDQVRSACFRHGCEEHALFVERGDVIFWDGMLPHCGTPIADPSHTRHSIVMHTIPYGTSVYHAEVFFNPHAAPEPKAWSYRTLAGGRRMIDHGKAHFG